MEAALLEHGVNRPRSAGSAAWALALLVPAPTVGVIFGLIVAPGPVGQAVWTVSKVWLLALPVVWLMAVDRRRPALPRWRWAGMPAGMATGLGIFAAILAAYFAVGRHWIETEAVRSRAVAAGLSSPAIYLAMAVYWCTINALLEEYVWRWFVFTRGAALMGAAWAIPFSALLFTLHHILALGVYFDPLLAGLGSVGVFIGGAVWAWLYARWSNLYAAWLSHFWADVAVFLIGYWLIFG
jgi:membrane protease YdiL (CAAX protease family)